MGCDRYNYEQKIDNRIEQGKRDVYNADGFGNRVDAVKSTINDCADCGMKVLNDSINSSGSAIQN